MCMQLLGYSNVKALALGWFEKLDGQTARPGELGWSDEELAGDAG